MADSLLSPAVGGAMVAATGATIAWCSHKLRTEGDERKVPLMGVLGAFLFAAQMINFSIPGTGSSGHLGGGLLLTLLLGPHAALIVMASVLVIQSLFFADGGLLALGCNVFNLGFIPAFVVYPLVYQRLAGAQASPRRRALAITVCAMASLQLGALAVVLETVASGISALPFASFALFMLPIHLVIGIVEGMVTAAVISFVLIARPDVFQSAPVASKSIGSVFMTFLLAAAIIGGIVSWFASKDPDGLEWSIAKITGPGELKEPEEGLHAQLADLQRSIALLPGYSFPAAENTASSKPPETTGESNTGTTLAGLLGGLMTLVLSFVVGWLLRRRGRHVG